MELLHSIGTLLFTFLHEYGYLIHDFGPHYHEFHPDWLVKEPWNAASSLFFLVPVAYWFYLLRGKYKAYWPITVLLPLLALNGIGSTVYHAFRAHDFWLFLDFIPAAAAMLILTFYLWNRLLGKWYFTMLVVIAFMAMRGVPPLVFDFDESDRHIMINIGYFITGLMIMTPVIGLLLKTNFFKWKLFVASAFFLGMALLFRYIDNTNAPMLPMGVHWLWHVVSACAVFPMGWYIYHIHNVKITPVADFVTDEELEEEEERESTSER